MRPQCDSPDQAAGAEAGIAVASQPTQWPVWTHGKTRLGYRIGEKLLFNRTFSSLNLIVYLGDLEPDVRPPLPVDADVPAGVKMIVVRSQPIQSPLAWLHRHAGRMCYVPRQGARYFIDLRGSFQEYLAKFSAKTRSTLKRKVRRFADASGGNIDFRVYRTPGELAEFHPLARALASQTYQERLFDNALPDSDDFMSRMRDAAACDRARGFLLFLQGEPVAYLYCPIVGIGSVIYEFVGFASRHAELSPGTVLQYMALETLFDEGRFTSFDFTEGGGEHKKFFATDSIVCADTYYFAPSPAMLAAVYGHRLMNQGSRFAGTMLDRMGLKKAVKKLMRRQ